MSSQPETQRHAPGGIELRESVPGAQRHSADAAVVSTRDVEAHVQDTCPGNAGPGREPRSSRWQAASVVVGAVCLMIPTFGVMSAWGLFQVYWQDHQLADRSPTDISWIGSMFGFLDCFLGLPFGLVFDRWGVHTMLPIGCLVYWGSFLSLAWASTYGHLMVCFSIAGISAAIPTTVGFCVVDHWFTNHHASAMGIVSTGAPIGGILFSLVLRALFSRYDWQTSMYWLSSIIGFFMLVGLLLVRSRKQPGLPAATWDLGHFTSPVFVMITFCIFIFEFVLYTQWGSLPVFAALTFVGDVFFLQMTYNIGAILGRTIPPWLAVRWGRFNVLLLLTLFTIFTIFAIWVPLGSFDAIALYVVALFMGIGTGGFVPLGASCLSQLCDGRGYGKWLGSCYTIVSFATLIGNPINQAMLDKTGPRISVAFQGILLVLACFVCLRVRWLCLGQHWQWQAKI